MRFRAFHEPEATNAGPNRPRANKKRRYVKPSIRGLNLKDLMPS
jgi:hypothetical protein